MGGSKEEAEKILTAWFAAVGVRRDSEVVVETIVLDLCTLKEDGAGAIERKLGTELGAVEGFDPPLADLKLSGFVVLKFRAGAEDTVGVCNCMASKSKSKPAAKSLPSEFNSELDQSLLSLSPSKVSPLIGNESDKRGGSIGARTTGEVGDRNPDPELAECFNSSRFKSSREREGEFVPDFS